MRRSSLERAWRTHAIDSLYGEVERVAPPRASPEGLYSWLTHCIDAQFENGDMRIEALAIRMCGLDYSASTITSRFARAGLRSPAQYAMAMRCAAIGALLAHGADLLAIEVLANLASQQTIYRFIRDAEQRRKSSARVGTLMSVMRSESPGFAFDRYVVPLLPTAAARWTTRLVY